MVVRLRDVPRWFLNVLIVLLIILLLAVLLARHAIAGEVLRGDDDKGGEMVLRLNPGPCHETVVRWFPSRVYPEYREQMRDAELTWHGRQWHACWIDIEGRVYVLDEQGATLMGNGADFFPRRAFRKEVSS